MLDILQCLKQFIPFDPAIPRVKMHSKGLSAVQRVLYKNTPKNIYNRIKRR